jgi:putative peptidoglycan lipid II flippase
MEGGGRKARAAALFSLATGLSRVVGLLREVLVAYVFGVRGAINQFTIASQIPNVVRSLVADAALGAAFIPVFNELLEKGDEKRAWRVASTVTTLAFVGLASITALTMLFAEPLLGVFYDGPVPHIAVQLTWILMPTVVLLGFAGIVQAILNSFGEFFVPAIAPVLWNLVIAGGLLIALRVDDANEALLIYAWATLLGTVVQVLFPLPWLRGRSGRLRIAFDWRDPAVRRVFILMLPVTLGLGLINVNALVDTVFASILDAEEAPRAIESAFRVYMLPQGIFAVAIAAVLFPALSRFSAAGDTDGFRHTVGEGIRTIHYLLLPAAVFSAVLARPIVQVLFQRGAFDASQRDLVAQCLAAFSLGLAANGALLLLNRAFFSMQRPWLPTAAAAGNLLLNAVLDWLLYQRAGVWGIPLATSIANLVFFTVQWHVLRRSLGSLEGRRTVRALTLMLACCVPLAATAYGLWWVVDRALGDGFAPQLLGVVLGMAAGSAIYLWLTRRLRMTEADLVLGVVRRRLAR